MKLSTFRSDFSRFLAPALVAISLVVPAAAMAEPVPNENAGEVAAPKSHREVVTSVARMVRSSAARRLVKKEGLRLINVLWEDTGRYLGSSVGPNISDVTIEVEYENKRSRKVTRLMPVVRYPNFSDKTGDIDIDKFFVNVGNQAEGQEGHSVSLRELLGNPLEYMSLPNKGRIKGDTLLAKRDEHVLVSAQSTFLPIREGGSTRFWPVIFNYQSYERHPAVLTILVTRQGTSMTVVDNRRDTVGGGGQRLYFNSAGQRAPLTAERLKDVVSSGVTMNGESAKSLGDDANLLMLIQVPLKQPRRSRKMSMIGPSMDVLMGSGSAGPRPTRSGAGEGSNVDVAVLGHGPSMGPYTELDGLTIARDKRFPVRVTVQFYQATSNGVVAKQDIARMAAQIEKVYSQADYVGSLVVPKGAQRPTMWDGASREPNGLSWQDFAGLRARYQTFGWAGLVYRNDMVSGSDQEAPHPAAALVAAGCNHVINQIF